MCVLSKGGMWGQPARQRLLLTTRVRPQSFSEYASLIVIGLHTVWFWFSFSCYPSTLKLPTTTVKTIWAWQAFDCFIRRGEGSERNRWCPGEEGGAAKRRHREQKQPSVRFPQGRPFTAEWRWRDLPGSKEALQQTFQQRFERLDA